MKHLRQFNAIGTVSYIATVPIVQERFAWSYAQMIAYNASHLEKEGHIFYDRVQMSWMPRARNDLVKSMRGEWIFMLDADLEFDPDCLEELLGLMKKYDAPVLSGIYVHKRKPHYPVLYSHNQQRGVYEIIAKFDGTPEIFQVDAAGAGCLLVKKFVFDHIWEKLKEDPFDIIGNNGEDMSFFRRLEKVGIGVYCAPQIKFSHLTTVALEYNPRQYDPQSLTKPYER